MNYIITDVSPWPILAKLHPKILAAKTLEQTHWLEVKKNQVIRGREGLWSLNRIFSGIATINSKYSIAV